MTILQSSTTRRISVLAIGLIAVSLAIPSTTAAGGGVSPERIRHETQNEVDEFLSEACGVTVVGDSRVDIHILEFRNGTSKIHINSWSTLSSPHGEVKTIGTSMIQFAQAQVIDNGDGTETLVVPHREAVSSIVRTDGNNTTDAGVIDWELRLVTDGSTGDVLDLYEIVVDTTGHFPTFGDDGSGVVPALCDALTD